MPLYRRFVTYLFFYENQQKGKNCGFAKVDARQSRCRMEIQVKGCEDGEYHIFLLHNAEEESVKAAIAENEDGDEPAELYGAGRRPEGIEIGVVRVSDGFGTAVFVLDCEKIEGSPFGLEDIFGIYLTAGKGQFAASQWEDGEVDWGSFRAYDRKERDDAEENSVVAADPDGKDGGSESMTGEETVNYPDEADMENQTVTAEESKPEMQATQAAVSADIFPYMTAWEKQWQRFCALHPVFCPFDEVQNIYAVKVDLRDLRSLPKQYRPLANNSFLLHGYFNYRYLLFGCVDGEKKKWFLAVPGVFQNQEQLMAGIFGFTEFRTKQVTKQKTGEFGFWYRFLEM